MDSDLFISYAWTSNDHRQWVAQLKALGYDVLIDVKVDYGDSLIGFMRKVADAKHALLIVDENYVERANNLPESGVGRKNKSIAEVIPSAPIKALGIVRETDTSISAL